MFPESMPQKGQYIADNTPAYVSSATNLGEVDPYKMIEVSIWLQPHGRSTLDALPSEAGTARSKSMYGVVVGHHRKHDFVELSGPKAASTGKE
jgi:hypothetical protein